MPTGGAIRQAVFDHDPHGQVDDSTGVMTAGPGQIGQIDIEMFTAVGAIVRRVGGHEINRTTGSQIPQVVQGALVEFVTLGQMPASRAGTVVIVGIVGH